MSFRNKLFILFVLLASVMILVSIIAVRERFQFYTIQQVHDQFVQAPSRFNDFQVSSLNSLISLAANISDDPTLRGTLSTMDRPTIIDAVEKTYPLYNTELFWVLDTKGTVLHRVEMPQKWGDSVAERIAVRDAISGYDSGDIWSWSGKLYQVAAAPIQSGSRIFGVLLIGRSFDTYIEESFAGLTGTDIAFLLSESGRYSSNSSISEADFKQAIETQTISLSEHSQMPVVPWWPSKKDDRMSDAPFIQFDVDHEKYAGALFSLHDVGNHPLATGILFQSLAPMQILNKRIQNTLITVGILTIIFALTSAFFIARGLTRPIDRLVDSSRLLGQGDLDTKIKPESNDEIGVLAHSLDDMRESLKTAREELIRGERLSTIGRMASMITHDFRQPITVIYGLAQIIEMQALDDDKRKEYTDRILYQIDRMQGMITELLDFAKGKVKLVRTKIELASFLKELVENFQIYVKSKNISLVLKNSWDGHLLLDRNRIERVLENIVRNAVQAIKKDGTIVVSTGYNEGMVCIEITDDGPGMPHDVRENLFKAFYTSGKSGGTGLGLAMALKVIEEHSGTIEVESELGKGTCFRILLPEKTESSDA